MVPHHWIFPSTNIKDSWNLWHFGNLSEMIRPLRCLKKMDLEGAAQITLWSKTSGVVRAISQVMVEMKLVEKLEDVVKLSSLDSSRYFDQAIVQLMEKVRAGSTQDRSRWTEMSVHRLYALIHKGQKRKRADEQAEAVPSDDMV